MNSDQISELLHSTKFSQNFYKNQLLRPPSESDDWVRSQPIDIFFIYGNCRISFLSYMDIVGYIYFFIYGNSKISFFPYMEIVG